jgi:hypothetical protein
VMPYGVDLTKLANARLLEVRPVRPVLSNGQQLLTDSILFFIQRDERNQQWVGTAPQVEVPRWVWEDEASDQSQTASGAFHCVLFGVTRRICTNSVVRSSHSPKLKQKQKLNAFAS